MKIKKEEYCVLYIESKGYYLSKLEIAQSLSFTPIEVGSKRDCENYINENNDQAQLINSDRIQ